MTGPAPLPPLGPLVHRVDGELDGHGDVVAGALATAKDDAFWQRIRAVRAHGGAIPGAFEAWLLQRGMRTVYLRVRQASRSARAIAEAFVGHPAVAAVLYLEPDEFEKLQAELPADAADAFGFGILAWIVAGGALVAFLIGRVAVRSIRD